MSQDIIKVPNLKHCPKFYMDNILKVPGLKYPKDYSWKSQEVSGPRYTRDIPEHYLKVPGRKKLLSTASYCCACTPYPSDTGIIEMHHKSFKNIVN